MIKPNYKVIKDNLTNGEVIQRIDADGKISIIPMDEGNSDYQAYLKRDEPQVEHLTEIPTN